MPDSSLQFDDAAAPLIQALHWRAQRSLPRGHFAGSLLGHALLTLPFVVLSGGAPVSPVEAAHTEIAMPVFAAKATDASPEPPPPPTLALSTGQSLPVPIQSPATPDIKVDLSAIRLSFDLDIRGELPGVVAAQRGMLALMDTEEPGIAHFLFHPPDWEGIEEIRDVSRSLRIQMSPPDKWPVFRAVAARYHIDLSRYQACALFDVAFRHCLRDAILARAAQSPAPQRPVSAARLAISMSDPCGIRVVEVSYAGN